jgi:hypothetical protein
MLYLIYEKTGELKKQGDFVLNKKRGCLKSEKT